MQGIKHIPVWMPDWIFVPRMFASS